MGHDRWVREIPGRIQPATNGMAATTRVDNTVRVTITHSDSAATASEAATAFVSLDDAARADLN